MLIIIAKEARIISDAEMLEFEVDKTLKELCGNETYKGKCLICNGAGETMQFADNCPSCKGKTGVEVIMPLIEAVKKFPMRFMIIKKE